MQVEREGHRSHSSVGRVVAQRLGSGGRYDCNVGKTNSISEALRELGLQLWRKISGIGRKSSARDEEWDELDQVAAELEAEAGVGEEYEEGEESEADEEGEDDDESEADDEGDESEADEEGEDDDESEVDDEGDESEADEEGEDDDEGEVDEESDEGDESEVGDDGDEGEVDDAISLHTSASGLSIAEREVEIDLTGVDSLDLESRNGNVIVEATEDDETHLVGTASVRCGGANPAEASARVAAAVVTHRLARGVAVIRVEFPSASSSEVRAHDGASFDLGVPSLDGLALSTSNGHVVSSGFSGQCVIRTSNGAVRVSRHDGEIDIETSNAKVDVEGFSPLEFIKVSSSNGAIHVVAHDASVVLELRTSNDGIHVELPSEWEGVVEARTSNDSIEVRSPSGRAVTKQGRRSVTIGTGGASLTAKTSNGAIKVQVG